MDYDNKPDINFCPTADNEDKNLSSSQHHIERQLLRQPDDVSSYDIETMRRMMFDMIQDLNMMTDSNTNTGIDSIESLFSKITSHQPMCIPKSKSYPNRKESSAQHFDSSGNHKVLVPVSSRFSMRSSSIPLFVECSNEYSSMMDECNDDDDVLSASHLSMVHADAGYEVTSVDLQQMVHHICSSSPDQFVNHCLRECRQRHLEAKSLKVRTSFSMNPNNDKAMMQSIRQVSDQMTMHHRNDSYTTNPRSSLCLPCSDPNSVAFLQEIEPLPFRR
jgi:hypothetical protein